MRLLATLLTLFPLFAAANTVWLSTGSSCEYAKIEVGPLGNILITCKATGPLPPAPPPVTTAGCTADENLQSKDVPAPGSFTFCSTRPVALSWSALPAGCLLRGSITVAVSGEARLQPLSSFQWGTDIPAGRHTVTFGAHACPVTLRVDTIQR
jgi:hypothetical protein